MGSSESKMTVHEEKKAEPAVKKTQISHLIDPRSPSAGIDRTPIQFGNVSKISAEVKNECPPTLIDPRSPSTGITRTPVREVMRATVGSFARRLGMIFHLEDNAKAADGSQKCTSEPVDEKEVIRGEELAPTEPLLTAQLPDSYGSLTERAELPGPAVTPRVQRVDDVVIVEEPQVEVEIETEADINLDDAEEAKESPLHKRLSMSLIAYHEGETSSNIFVEVHRENTSSPELSVDVELLGDGVDHCYALPSVAVEPEYPAGPSVTTDAPAHVSPVQPEEAPKPSSSEVAEEPRSEPSPLSETSPSEPPAVSTPEPPQVCTGIRCPSFDSKSPSQVVFKPQWLGKGFGATGLRAKGVQGHRGKGGSSPLAVRVGVKNTTNENKGHSGKLKQKGTEGRSPLQILKETNSLRDQRTQMKLKVSTPDTKRPGQTDRRVLAVSLDKENR
ncbi:cell division cycle-associated protein 3 [Salarias fasciatus]|uniref:Uncharacterized protein n=1 Tax=Salarias fasciatus TaxID=181472 RepID=A0A672HHU1_SALFA|nr:cell division cycle-associated protein 3 [Salarias fasciatus]